MLDPHIFLIGEEAVTILIEVCLDGRHVWTRHRTPMDVVLTTIRVTYKSRAYAAEAYRSDVAWYRGIHYVETQATSVYEGITSVPETDLISGSMRAMRTDGIRAVSNTETLHWETTDLLRRGDISRIYSDLSAACSRIPERLKPEIVMTDDGNGTLISVDCRQRNEQIVFGFAGQASTYTGHEAVCAGFIGKPGYGRGTYEVRHDMADFVVRILLHQLHERFGVKVAWRSGGLQGQPADGWLIPSNTEAFPWHEIWLKDYAGQAKAPHSKHFIYTPVGEPSSFCW